MGFFSPGHNAERGDRRRQLELKLDLPLRTAKKHPQFALKPRQVEAWISGLPLVNLGETSRLLYKALMELNRIATGVPERLQIMDLIQQPVQDICESLAHHLKNQPFPLPEKSQKVALLTRQFEAEMALGYQIVVHDIVASGSSRTDTRILVRAAHQALRYLGRILYACYRTYSPYPKGTWTAIHQLYHFAEIQDLHQLAATGEGGDGGPSAIADVYKEILLLALASPYRLRQSELESLLRLLPRLSRPARLLPFAHAQDGQGIFLVDLKGDSQPSYLEYSHNVDAKHSRVFDTSAIVTAIETGLAAATSAKQEQTGVSSGLWGLAPQDLLRKLFLSWGVSSKRSFPRTPRIAKVEVAFGTSAVHHFVSGELDFNRHFAKRSIPLNASTKGAPEPAKRNSSSQFMSRPTLSELEGKKDIWSTVYRPDAAEQDNDQGAEPESSAASVTYTAHVLETVDISAGGCCLRGQRKLQAYARVGELIAMRDVDPAAVSRWSIGVIRRIRNEAGDFELGVQVFSAHARAVATRLVGRQDPGSDYLRSFLLPEDSSLDQPATLITPALPYKAGSTVLVSDGHDELRMALTQLLENTGNYSQFLFTAIATPKTAAKPVTSTGPEADDTFDSLWSSL